MSDLTPTNAERRGPTPPETAPKKEYRTPRLTVHGGLRELTLANRTGTTWDNNARSTRRSRIGNGNGHG